MEDDEKDINIEGDEDDDLDLLDVLKSKKTKKKKKAKKTKTELAAADQAKNLVCKSKDPFPLTHNLNRGIWP